MSALGRLTTFMVTLNIKRYLLHPGLFLKFVAFTLTVKHTGIRLCYFFNIKITNLSIHTLFKFLL